MAIQISAPEHWQSLTAERLTVVVDPMVVRAGEIFLQGATGTADVDRKWDFLSRNVHALAMFFDTVILEGRMPVFNYGDTYGTVVGFKERAFAALNNAEPVLYIGPPSRGRR